MADMEQEIEVIDASEIPAEGVGQTAARDYGTRLADEYLYGPLPESERAWRLTVKRLDDGYQQMMRDVGVRAPKSPKLAPLRLQVLKAWKVYKTWARNATSAPRGMLAPQVMKELGPHKKAYRRVWANVAEVLNTKAPSAAQATVVPGKAPTMPGGGFLGDVKDAAVLVAILGGGAWLLFGKK